MTDNNEFDNLRTLHAVIGPEGWEIDKDARGYTEVVAGKARLYLVAARVSEAEAAFIVAAKNELPALLARLDEVTAERDALAAVIEKALDFTPEERMYDGGTLGSRMRKILAAAPSSVLAAHDAKVRAEAWDECIDAIEEHELNTEQAREGNPYRTKEGN